VVFKTDPGWEGHQLLPIYPNKIGARLHFAFVLIDACRRGDTDKKRTATVILFCVACARVSSHDAVTATCASGGRLSTLHSRVPAIPPRSIGKQLRRRGRHEG